MIEKCGPLVSLVISDSNLQMVSWAQRISATHKISPKISFAPRIIISHRLNQGMSINWQIDNPFQMTFGLSKGVNLRNIITYNVI